MKLHICNGIYSSPSLAEKKHVRRATHQTKPMRNDCMLRDAQCDIDCAAGEKAIMALGKASYRCYERFLSYSYLFSLLSHFIFLSLSAKLQFILMFFGWLYNELVNDLRICILRYRIVVIVFIIFY